MTRRSVGVEEELILLDAESGWPRALARAVIRRADQGSVDEELQQEQVETGAGPCEGLDDLAREVRRWRDVAARAAATAGAQVAAVGTCPLPVDPSVTPTDRYREIVEEFGLIGHEQLTCGLHVHVDVAGDEEAVGALDRMRLWLPVMIAMSANSPFWQGVDTGYASFRSQAWSRWPSAGPGGPFGSVGEYRALVDDMLATGAVRDEGMVYFDARLSAHYPTLEVRVADVCLHADDSVLLAALTRALVDTAAREWREGVPAPRVRTELLRVVNWRAGRSGLTDELVHPTTMRPVPAWEAVAALVDHVRESLEDAGDAAVVEGLLAALRSRGTGAEHQRSVLARTGRLEDVLRDAADVTLSG